MTSKITVLDEPCVCGKIEDECECELGFFAPEEIDGFGQSNPQEDECYCLCAFQPESDCALVEWRPADAQTFQVRLVKKIFSALRGYWAQGEGGHLSLDLNVCPAEALWIAKALKSHIKCDK